MSLSSYVGTYSRKRIACRLLNQLTLGQQYILHLIISIRERNQKYIKDKLIKFVGYIY